MQTFLYFIVIKVFYKYRNIEEGENEKNYYYKP